MSESRSDLDARIDLDDIAIASPCSAKWEDMKGDDRSRHCAACRLDVYDLSAMTRAEAITLLTARSDSVCIRLHRRADGRVITKDCPVGVRRALRRAGSIVGGMILGAVGIGLAGWILMSSDSSKRSSDAGNLRVPPEGSWDAAVDRAAHATGLLRFCRCEKPAPLMGSRF